MSDEFFISVLSFFITEGIGSGTGLLLLQELSDWHCLSCVCSNNPLCPGMNMQNLLGKQGISLLKFYMIGQKKSFANNRMIKAQKAQIARELCGAQCFRAKSQVIFKRDLFVCLVWLGTSSSACMCALITEHVDAQIWVKEMPSVWVVHVLTPLCLTAQAEAMKIVMQMKARQKQWGFCKSNFCTGLNKEHCKSYPKYFLCLWLCFFHSN